MDLHPAALPGHCKCRGGLCRFGIIAREEGRYPVDIICRGAAEGDHRGVHLPPLIGPSYSAYQLRDQHL